MTDIQSSLPRELSVLVEHIELNRAGWWDKTLTRLVLAAIWLCGKNPDETTISKTIEDAFGLTVRGQKLASAIKALREEDYLVELPAGAYRIPEKARKELDREVAQAEEAEAKAKDLFLSLVTQYCPELDASEVWSVFERDFLIPMVRDVGVQTYRLIAGEGGIPDGTHAEKFLLAFGAKHENNLKIVVSTFLDPKHSDVRGYVTRLLHAHFCVEASGVSEAVLEKLKTSTAKPVQFRLFVDTNFLFSLLGLHENPSNASARELQELLGTLNDNPQVSFCITPKTIDEARRVIRAAKEAVVGVPLSENFTKAALRVGMSGISERYFAERQGRTGLLTASDWFDPYLSDFVSLAREAGIELYNEKLDAYGTRQDVVDDICSVMEHEKKTYSEDRRKSYENVAHDVILWHVAKDKRPAYVESPIEAQEWILTVDFRFLGFDQHKLKVNDSNVPVCLHPTALIQLLQFWIPRTRAFEEAVLGGLRLPFLFKEFDAEAERLSLNIIKKIGLFEGSDKISDDTLVRVVFNDGLRHRLEAGQPEEEEIRLVRDALVEEGRSVAEAANAKVMELTALVEDKTAAISEAQRKSKEKDLRIKELEEEAAERKREVARSAEVKLHRRTIALYLGILLGVMITSGIGSWATAYMLPDSIGTIVRVAACIVVGVCIFILGHLVLEVAVRRRRGRMNQLWPFVQITRFRKWLWGLIITLMLGVAVSVIVQDLQVGKTSTNVNEHSLEGEHPDAGKAVDIGGGP